MNRTTLLLACLMISGVQLAGTASAQPGCILTHAAHSTTQSGNGDLTASQPVALQATWDQTGANCVPEHHCSISVDGTPITTDCTFPYDCRSDPDPVIEGYCSAKAAGTTSLLVGPHTVVATFTIETFPETTATQTWTFLAIST